MAYLDLNTIHNPSPLTAPPAGYGDQIRDNFEAVRLGLTWPLTVWTPAFYAGAVPVACSVQYAKYRRIGDRVEGAFRVTLTATAGASGLVFNVRGYPAAHADVSALARFPVGAGSYARTGPQYNTGLLVFDPTNVGFALLRDGSDGYYGSSVGAPVTATTGDVFSGTFAYPAA